MSVIPTSQNVLEQDYRVVERLRDRLNQALRGKSDVIEQVLICLFARGHLLLEDKPGLGKTTLAKSLADALGGSFARVQCTPDLLPSDITGFNIYNQKSQEFEFRPGPVFADILLTDEINRATPRTQSALLEAMAERQVTVDTERSPLAEEFFVIATQNPIDQHGTYPLPEAQLDRFAMKLSIGYPAMADERLMLSHAIRGREKSDLSREALFDPKQLHRMQEEVAAIAMTDSVLDYLCRLAVATREHDYITLGLSPRGLLTWQRIAQASAFLHERQYVIPEDIQKTAVPVLSVRLGIEHSDPEPIIRELLEKTPLPDYTTTEVTP